MPPSPPQERIASAAPSAVQSPSARLVDHLKVLAAATLIVACVCTMFLMYVRLIGNGQNSPNRYGDFIEYWAAGQLMTHHANPYDPSEILRLQRAAGEMIEQPRVSFSPPILLFFVLPLGYVRAPVGQIGWMIAQVMALSLALWLLWRMHGRPKSKWHLLGLVFAPAVTSQMAGQIGDFLLLSVVLFLYLHRERPFWAGVALIPFALKSHLLLPFCLALIVWLALRRSFPMLGGFLLALAVALAVPLCFDPLIWTQYRSTMHQFDVLSMPIPTLSVGFRLLVDKHAAWVQFVPEACACAWALFYFWRRRSQWDWNRDGLLLLLVGAVATPYGFNSDEAIVLPAVLAGLYRVLDERRSAVPLLLLGGAALIEGAVAKVPLGSFYYVWTAPAWLAWYIYAFRGRRPGPAAMQPAMEMRA